jgi:hypothetical protein
MNQRARLAKSATAAVNFNSQTTVPECMKRAQGISV